MSTDIAQLQEDRSQYQEQLDLVVGSLHDDPDNDELRLLKEELQAAIALIDESLAELQPKASSTAARAASTEPTSTSADSHRDRHGGSHYQQQQQQQQAPAVPLKVGDSVLARWVSGDRAYYPARVMSVTGSLTAPMYTVKFKSYDTVETLQARDIRPVGGGNSNNNNNNNNSNAHKRKTADSSEVSGASTTAGAAGTAAQPLPPAPAAAQIPALPRVPLSAAGPPPPPPPPPPQAEPSPMPPLSHFRRTMDRFSSGIVSSSAPQLYPEAVRQLASAKSGVSGSGSSSGTSSRDTASTAATAGGAGGGTLDEGPPVKKFKKIKATKQLEAGKSKWQDFNNKSKLGKTLGKKESMFRTPEGVNGRVGFTGSGQAMRKDPSRNRHVYQTNDDLD